VSSSSLIKFLGPGDVGFSKNTSASVSRPFLVPILLSRARDSNGSNVLFGASDVCRQRKMRTEKDT
jgi:hypothetical protein